MDYSVDGTVGRNGARARSPVDETVQRHFGDPVVVDEGSGDHQQVKQLKKKQGLSLKPFVSLAMLSFAR